MKTLLLFTGILMTVNCAVLAQSRRIDSVAVLILQRMSGTISELHSLNMTVKTDYDLPSDDLGLVKHSDRERIYITMPDKMMVAMEGDKGQRSYWYNGKKLSYYSFDNNVYAQIAAPQTLLQTIDSMSKMFDIEFPAADFLYPSFVNDILDTAFNLIYLGITEVDNKRCFHIAGTTTDMTFQFWINDDAFFLPMKMVIIYTDKAGMPQYQATYTDWKLNPDLPLSLFEFVAPPGAGKTKLMSKLQPNSQLKNKSNEK